ncbi:MAG TPA: heme-binding protein [Thermoplasmata archaeon]|jgi:hypothetical protein
MTESVAYDVVRRIGRIEVRKYPSVLLATVEGQDDDEAFGILFQFISGGNVARRKVAMTVPVVSKAPSSERMAMTAPVISGKRTFSFAMPSEYTARTVPKPVDDRIRMIEIPERTVAALSFSGRSTDDMANRKAAELASVLKANGVRVKGESFLMRYNSPFMPGFLRRNEVAVEIE